MDSTTKNSKLTWVGRVISWLAVLPFLPSVYFKLHPTSEMLTQMGAMGVPQKILPVLAVLEGLCVVVYLIPQTAVLGVVLFTGYLGGAIETHLRAGQPVTIPLALALFLWLGLYLREPRLRQLLPLRC